MKPARTLFIGLEGAEFEIFERFLNEGRMPYFANLCKNGVNGLLHPVIPGEVSTCWATAFTGVFPDIHGVYGERVLDVNFDGVKPPNWQDLQSSPVWKEFESAGLTVNRIAAPLTHPASSALGACVSQRYPGHFLPGGKWSDLSNAVFSAEEEEDGAFREQLTALRYHPIDVTHQWVQRFIPKVTEIDQGIDRRPAALGTALARSLSIHNAATFLMEERPAALEMVHYPFWSDLCRIFLPYLAPKPDSIDSRDFELYQNVIPVACELFDEMLGRLLELCGSDTFVCLVSNYGFQLEESLRGRKGKSSLAFKPVFRPQGHYLLSGPLVNPDAVIHASCEVDIAPTLLAAANIPLMSGLDGRPWIEAFRSPLMFSVTAEIARSRERQSKKDTHASQGRLDVSKNLKLLENEGYSDPLAQANQLDAAKLLFDQDLKKFSLLVYREQVEEATRLACSLCQRRVRALGLRLYIIQKLFYLNQIEAAAALGEEALILLNEVSIEDQSKIDPSIAPQARLALLNGLVAWGDDRIDAAISYFDEAANYPVRSPLTHLLRGDAYFRLNRYSSALAAFEMAEQGPDFVPDATVGKARCLIVLDRHDEALEPLLQTIEHRPNAPRPQYLIAVVLDQLGQASTAVAALQRCLQLKPNHKKAKALLKQIQSR